MLSLLTVKVPVERYHTVPLPEMKFSMVFVSLRWNTSLPLSTMLESGLNQPLVVLSPTSRMVPVLSVVLPVYSCVVI